MKRLSLLFIVIFYSCSSKKVVDMDEVLYDRSGQYITANNYDESFFSFWYNQKVYNGPAFNKYRTGEKREQGPLKNGFKSGVWTGYYKDGSKKFDGEYKKGKAYGKWVGYHPNGNKKYEGLYEEGFQTSTWFYFNKKGMKTLEEEYFVCTDQCKDEHPPNRAGRVYVCEKLGRMKGSKKI